VEQNTDLQHDALRAAGCWKVFTDHVTGTRERRPQLDQLIGQLRSGDTLLVWRLDRLGRSLRHLIGLVGELAEHGVGFRSLTENIDTTTAGGRLIFHVFGALAEFSARPHCGQHGGGARRRSCPRPVGRPQTQAEHPSGAAGQQLYDAGQKTVGEIAAIFKVPRTTLYGHLDKTSIGGRPRSRNPTPTCKSTLRPRPAAPGQETLTAPGHDVPRPTERQRIAMRASRCPTCGNEPTQTRHRWQQRQDLATIWLHLDGNTVRE
jgi:DNA invertase Pin-like site-specific DNA recombinase